VSTLGQNAFNSTVLTSVVMQSATPPSVAAAAVPINNLAGLLIHVPNAAAVTAYQAATGWSTYGSKIVTP
jgi:hypothetical protein